MIHPKPQIFNLAAFDTYIYIHTYILYIYTHTHTLNPEPNPGYTRTHTHTATTAGVIGICASLEEGDDCGRVTHLGMCAYVSTHHHFMSVIFNEPDWEEEAGWRW